MDKERLLARLFAIQIMYNIPQSAMDDIYKAILEFRGERVVSFRIELDTVLKKVECPNCGVMNIVFNKTCENCKTQL